MALLFVYATGGRAKPAVNFTPSPNFVEVESSARFVELLGSGKPVLVDFYAQWCGPCASLKPVLHELADQYAGRVTVAGVDIDKLKDLAEKYGVTTIPDVRLFVGGEPVARVGGARAKKHYVALLEKQLKPGA